MVGLDSMMDLESNRVSLTSKDKVFEVKLDFKRQCYYFLQCLGHPQEGKALMAQRQEEFLEIFFIRIGKSSQVFLKGEGGWEVRYASARETKENPLPQLQHLLVFC